MTERRSINKRHNTDHTFLCVRCDEGEILDLENGDAVLVHSLNPLNAAEEYHRYYDSESGKGWSSELRIGVKLIDISQYKKNRVRAEQIEKELAEAKVEYYISTVEVEVNYSARVNEVENE